MSVFFPYISILLALCRLCLGSDPFIRPELLLLRVRRPPQCRLQLERYRGPRPRLRPMARGAISLPAAYVFTAAQVSVWLAALFLLLPGRWPLHAAPVLLLVWLYPFAKRVTNYAQIVLGITLGWGVQVGAAVMGLDVLGTDADAERAGLAGVYLVCVVWTMILNTVYAHQDVRDDMKAGIKSMAVLWLHWTKALLWVLSFVQIGILWSIGIWMKAGGWHHSQEGDLWKLGSAKKLGYPSRRMFL